MRRLAVGLLAACALAGAGGSCGRRERGRRHVPAARERGGERSRGARAAARRHGRRRPAGRVAARADRLARARGGAAARRCAHAHRAVPPTRRRRAARPPRSWPAPTTAPRHAGVLARALSWLARLLSIPAGADGVLGLIVLGVVVAAVGRAGGAAARARRAGCGGASACCSGREGAFGVGSADPEELERRASAAEAAGRFEEAMRLQLAAALTRLDAAGTIRVRRDTTLGQVARSLRSHDFDAAADRFAGRRLRSPASDGPRCERAAGAPRRHGRGGGAAMSGGRRLLADRPRRAGGADRAARRRRADARRHARARPGRLLVRLRPLRSDRLCQAAAALGPSGRAHPRSAARPRPRPEADGRWCCGPT